MDKLNAEQLKGKPDFCLRDKQELLEPIIEGSYINIGCANPMIEDTVNIDEGL